MDKTEKENCDYPEYAHEFVSTYWYWITASIYFFLPFILISIFTGLIIVSLRQQRKAREAIGATTQSTSGRTTDARVEQTICIMMVCTAILGRDSDSSCVGYTLKTQSSVLPETSRSEAKM
ncbi:hypothetical protein C0Q70_09158 [Pomacea canaliculata]|uniref:G-protein coupled receptors family 1 profile domain-containing protein n=1 Tax=Pomacea canaliculata TaxID=400727 RepID=A0A2T7P921_POMCA|nr:hypothetical protein C0Q70_09158 [Pomacea canaliculata]